MNLIPQTEDELRTIFVASCIESAANALDIPASEMHKRMQRVGLIENYIWRCYDTLHTQSREYVTSDILEALENWEKNKIIQR